MIRLKICGMRDTANIAELLPLAPDYMGFIFYPASPRYVGHDFSLPPDFPAATKRVGVFVNATTEEMLQQARKLSLDYLQLHGQEPVEQVAALKAHGMKIIKVFSVEDDFDFRTTTPYQAVSDFFLFDTKGKYYGGNAKTFNWQILTQYDQRVPFFLSGGLTPENIASIKTLKGMNLHAIDINSGVELSPGVKSKTLASAVKDSLKLIL